MKSLKQYITESKEWWYQFPADCPAAKKFPKIDMFNVKLMYEMDWRVIKDKESNQYYIIYPWTSNPLGGKPFYRIYKCSEEDNKFIEKGFKTNNEYDLKSVRPLKMERLDNKSKGFGTATAAITELYKKILKY